MRIAQSAVLGAAPTVVAADLEPQRTAGLPDRMGMQPIAPVRSLVLGEPQPGGTPWLNRSARTADARRAHSKDGCIEWLEPISSGKECSCKRKYTDGGWVQGNPKVG
jgi:hypothetical protein